MVTNMPHVGMRLISLPSKLKVFSWFLSASWIVLTSEETTESTSGS